MHACCSLNGAAFLVGLLQPAVLLLSVQNIPTVDEAMHITAAILEAHGIGQAAFVAHSYGEW
jgi:hypothetical protein